MPDGKVELMKSKVAQKTPGADEEKSEKIAKKTDDYARGAGQVDFRIFAPSLLIILAVAVPLFIDPSFGQVMVQNTHTFITKYFGWVFMWVPVICLMLIVILIITRYGDVVLGDPGDVPEFSYFAWVSMLFCCGVGSSSIVWGICEPIYYIDGPPLGIEPRSLAAYEMALALPIFHWGLSAWAVYAIAAVGIAYSLFVRKNPELRLSGACEGLIGKKGSNTWAEVGLEILVVIGSIGGFGASLGLGVPFVAEFIAALFDIPNTLWLKAGVVAVWTSIFCFSVFSGLAKGMLYLSKINIWLALGVLGFVFLVGPTLFSLEAITNSMGKLFGNFFALSFSIEPLNMAVNPETRAVARGSGFPQNWTVFYWCWWVALAPISGIFLGRISRGRTIRQTLIGITVWGSIGCAITLGILGAYSIHLEYTGELAVSTILAAHGTGPTAAKVLMHLPYAKFLVPFYVTLALIFLATTLDSAAFSLAAICTKSIRGDQQPARWQRLLWALVLGGFSMSILITGGDDSQSLRTVQTSAVAAGLPLLIGLFAMVLALFKSLKQDQKP